MANQNFKVKKGLEVGTGVTISGVDGNINISGILTATQFAGDGSALTGVTAAGSGVVVQEEGSNVGTAATINFIGSNVTAALSGGIANVTVSAGGLSNVVEDTTPQLGGNLDLNGKNITGIGSISITGGFNATGVSTFQENVVFQSTASFGDNDKINVGAGNDLQIFHDGTSNIIKDAVGVGISLVGNTKVVGVLTATSFSGSLATTDLTGTITNAQLAGSISNDKLAGSIADSKLASTFLKNVIEDTTPQLGGNLDVNSKDITGTGNVSLTGIVTATSFSGSGIGLTSIPAGQLTGTVADARLSTVSSSKLSGSLPALDGSALTDLTGASAGTYGASTNTPIITVDSNGRITGISTVATSGAGGGGGISNIIEDTTPQLGGNLDLNSKNINGTGNIDITGYVAVSGVSTFSGAVGFATHIHDAGTGGLDIRTNLLRIKNDADSETLATFAQDGAVSLYHDNALRIQTTTGGATVSGILTATTYVKASNSGGFLKADGTEDTSTYLTSETDPIVGAINGIVKANGSGTISAAVAGTDYLTPTGDGSGLTGIAGTAFSNVQVTWNVTSSGSSAYRFTGPGNDASDNNPDLYLVRGQRYRFTNNSGGSHPFQIRSSPGGSAYSTGVTNNGGASGNIDFNVQHDAPSRLYYQCTNHSGMVGNIYIVGGSDWRMTDVTTAQTPEIFTNLNVGIGTDNPGHLLDLYNSAGSDCLRLNVNGGAGGSNKQNAIRFSVDGDIKAHIGLAVDTGRLISGSIANDFCLKGLGSNNILFATNSSERLRITSAGRMLLGTTTVPTGLVLGNSLTAASSTGAEVVAFRSDTSVAVGDKCGAFIIGNSDTDGVEDHFVGMWGKVASTNGSMDLHFAAGRSSYEGDNPDLTIKSGGIVTKPNQPTFSAYGSNDAFTAQSPLPFDSTTSPLGYNIGNHYSTSTYKFTCPVDGYYYVTCHVVPTNYTSGGSNVELYIKDQSGNRYFLDRKVKTSNYASNNFSVGGSRILYKSAGNTLWVEFNAISGTPLLEASSHFGIMLMA